MKKIFYAQSGGVTSVINATMSHLISAARSTNIDVLIGIQGIHGLLEERFFDAKSLTDADLCCIAHTPGGSFGSCRRKILDSDLELIATHVQKHHIDAIIYQGGNDSQESLLKIFQYFQQMQIPCLCIGIPKTIDNDLFETEICPGFASAAYFLISAFRQIGCDLSSMCRDSTKVYIIETMGRHAGWLAASCGMAHSPQFPGPQILLVPEFQHSPQQIIEKILSTVKQDQYCMIALSEGYFSASSSNDVFIDSFGHKDLQGAGLTLRKMIEQTTKLKTRLCIPDYLQRSFFMSHCARDLQQSSELGAQTISLLHQGISGKMLSIHKTDLTSWKITTCDLEQVASKEKKLPLHYLSPDRWSLSQEGRDYFRWAIGANELNHLERFWPHYIHRNTIHQNHGF